MPSEYDALLDAQPAQKSSEYDALLEQPKQEGGVLSGIAAGIGRALNPINLIKGALDIGGESDISKISRYSHSLADIVSWKPVQESLEKNIPEVAQQRAALTGQLGGREQAAEITGLGLQAGLLALPFAHGKLATLRETAFGKTEAPLASETSAVEQIQKGGPSATEPNRETGALPTEQVQPTQQETAVQPETRDTRETPEEAPPQKIATAPEAFPSLLQSAEDARRSELRQEPEPVSEPTETTTAQPLTQEKGGEVGEKVQVKGEDEGKGKERLLTPEAATVQPPAAPPETPEQLGQALSEPARTAGVSNRVLQERAAKGEIPQAPESGTGILKEDLIKRANEQYSPERAAIAEQNVKAGTSSLDDEAVVTLHEEKLSKIAADAERALDADPKNPQLKEQLDIAKSALSQWHNETVQPMKTNWSNKGINLQGQTDIDTGSLVGLQKLAWDTAKRDFTPEETPVFKEAANRVDKSIKEEKSSISKANEEVQKVLKPKRIMDINQLRESIAESLKSITC